MSKTWSKTCKKATKTKTGAKAVLLKGQQFTAKFEVQSPAQQPRVTFDLPSMATGEQRIGLVAFDANRTLFANVRYQLSKQAGIGVEFIDFETQQLAAVGDDGTVLRGQRYTFGTWFIF